MPAIGLVIVARTKLARHRMRRYKSVVADGPLFGPLPTRGLWTGVGLTRGQFFSILALATALFVFVGGPLWRHLHDGHFGRIVVSYGLIPPLVFLALRRNGSAGVVRVVEASALVVFVKLVVTAALLVAMAIGR